MFNRILFWFGNSRLFSLPMTFMSWLIIFLYSLKLGGDILNGILALVGISFAHLATNLFDDYVDYKKLSCQGAFMDIRDKSKCDYIKSGQADISELLFVVIVYCAIASLIGILLTFRSGFGVVLLALIGGVIVLSYARLSSNGFSEPAVGVAFGPLLFEGVYYVMCKQFSLEVFVLSCAVVVFTVGLVYMNNILDYNNDVLCGKKSLCCRIGDKKKIAQGVIVLYSIGYLMCVVLTFLFKNWFYLLPIITFPLAIQLYKSVVEFFEDSSIIPRLRWWNFPMGNVSEFKEKGIAPFYFRLYFARNIMIWFSFIMVLVIIFC